MKEQDSILLNDNVSESYQIGFILSVVILHAYLKSSFKNRGGSDLDESLRILVHVLCMLSCVHPISHDSH